MNRFVFTLLGGILGFLIASLWSANENDVAFGAIAVLFVVTFVGLLVAAIKEDRKARKC